MGYLGAVEYLFPTVSLTSHIRETLSRLLFDTVGVPTTIGIHFDATEVDADAERFLRALGPRVRWSSWNTVGKRGPAAVRNRLASDSRAEFLVFVDSDVILTNHFDRNLRRVIGQAGTEKIIYPRILGVNPASHVSLFFQEHVFAPRQTVSGRMMITSAVFGMSAAQWHRGPKFDERFTGAGGEDWLFFQSIQQSPFEMQVVFDDFLVAFHKNPETVRELLLRADRYALQAHLHSPALLSRGLRNVSLRPIARLAYRALLAVNRWVARSSRRNSWLGFLSRQLPIVRNLLIAVVRKFRGQEGPRDTSWDHLLFMERVRFRPAFGPLPSEGLPEGDKLSLGKEPPEKSKMRKATRKSGVRNRAGKTYIFHSEEYATRHKVKHAFIRLMWVLEYRLRAGYHARKVSSA